VILGYVRHVYEANKYSTEPMYRVCVARLSYWGGGYRGHYFEQLLEASPVSDRANASRRQDRPAAGQG